MNMIGSRYWWPADSQFEVVIGAILTQQTRWDSVEKAIHNLKEKGLVDPEKLCMVKDEELQRLIRCTGFYRQKARRLKEISEFFAKNPDIFKKPTNQLRKKLLSLQGVGEETADSIHMLHINQNS